MKSKFSIECDCCKRSLDVKDSFFKGSGPLGLILLWCKNCVPKKVEILDDRR